MEHSSAGGCRELPPKLLAEQKAERYSVDLLVQGTTTVINGLIPVKAVIPIPTLSRRPQQPRTLPRGSIKNSASPTKPAQYNLVMSVYILPSFVFNPNLLAARTDQNAWKDLLAPKWKGKLVMRDPRLAGGGLAIATLWYVNPKLGKEFIQKIFTAQELALSRDDRQLLDFVGQAKFPIAIGPSEVLAKEWIGKGLPVRQTESRSAARGRLDHSGKRRSFNPQKIRRIRTPCKVYLDHPLSKEGQTEWEQSDWVRQSARRMCRAITWRSI